MHKKFALAILTALAVSLMGPFMTLTAFAQSGTASLPAGVMPLNGQWARLTPGGSATYAFQYAGDASTVTIIADAVPSTGITFSVWTPGDWANRASDPSQKPVGRGSPTVGEQPGQLIWSGNFDKTAGLYYVTVDQVGTTESDYQLHIIGTGVTMLAGTNRPAATAAPASAPAATTTAAVTTAAGTWQALLPGASATYSFEYAGDGSQIIIWAEAVPSDGITFEVWTPAQWMARASDASTKPVGRGNLTVGEQPGQLIWSGNFDKTAGTYYVTVEQAGMDQANYNLHITGDGVSAAMLAGQ